MLDMPTALRVTLNCIRKVAGLFPESDFPIDPKDTLLKLGIDDARVDLLKKRIAGDSQFGLPSLTPKRKINVALLQFDESSTVFDVFSAVSGNAVLA
jgi:hypothetical protein